MALDSQLSKRRLRSPETRSWIIPAILIAAGTFVLELTGVLGPFDDLAADWSARLLAHRCHVPAKVLLIYADPQPSEQESEQLLALMPRLEELRARHIAFAMPLPHDVDAYCEGRQNVTVGDIVERDRFDPEVLRALPRTSRDEASPIDAVVSLPSARRGVYREQLASVAVAGNRYPTLESTVAERLRAHSAGPTYRIRFRGGAGSLPHMTLAEAIGGDLVPELVKGRTVLIGRGEGPSHVAVATPTTEESQQMPVLELHGHALNTLLTGSPVASTSPAINCLVYVALALVAGLLFESTTARSCGLLLLVLLALDAGCLVFGMWGLHVQMPATQIAVVFVACFLRTIQRRNAFAQTAWQELVQDLHGKLRRRRWPTGFFSEEEPWSQIASFVHQTLNLNRLIILELPADSFHVREVKALNCALADVDEVRRDCRRWPYVAALDEKQPIALDTTRPFLRLEADEQQYLVSLVFGGEAFGFMAVCVPVSELADASRFERRLSEFADQIAELLYRRRRVLSGRKQEASLLARLRRSPDTRIYGELVHAAHLLEGRMARLENMFEQSLTAAAIYDVFGRLMMVNGQMTRLLQKEGVIAAELTTLDLISVLTNLDQQAARQMLRTVITAKRHESVPVTLDHQKRDYLFNIRPMDLEVPDSHRGAASESPFQLQGILCELVDRSDVMQTHRVRQYLAEGFGNNLRNDFAAVDMAATLIADGSAPAEQRSDCTELIHTRIQSALKSLAEFEQLIPTDLYSAEEECLPIAPVPVLQEAMAAVAGQAEDRGIEIRLLRSPLTSHVFAAPNRLPRVCEVILDFLLLDASDDSELGIHLEETPTDVVLTFENEGFGVALDSAHELFGHDSFTKMSESESLREIVNWVHAWGGQLSSQSEIGSGTSLKLALRKFQ